MRHGAGSAGSAISGAAKRSSCSSQEQSGGSPGGRAMARTRARCATARRLMRARHDGCWLPLLQTRVRGKLASASRCEFGSAREHYLDLRPPASMRSGRGTLGDHASAAGVRDALARDLS